MAAVGKTNHILEVVEKSVKLNPEFAEAHERLAYWHFIIPFSVLGTADEYSPRSVSHAKTSLVVDSERLWAKSLLALTDKDLPYVCDESLKILEAVVTAQPQSSYARVASVSFLLVLGYFENALRAIDASIVQDL
ncbi:MAG: hypothetical protein ACI89U_000287 [Gammaproteobacteria bacterium]